MPKASKQYAVNSKQSKSPHPPFSKGGQGGDLVLLQQQWLLVAVARTVKAGKQYAVCSQTQEACDTGYDTGFGGTDNKGR
jgi:hypothetical protein